MILEYEGLEIWLSCIRSPWMNWFLLGFFGADRLMQPDAGNCTKKLRPLKLHSNVISHRRSNFLFQNLLDIKLIFEFKYCIKPAVYKLL